MGGPDVHAAKYPFGQSLRWRLPLLISALLLVVVTAVVYAAYREVERTLHQAAADRARSAATQVATLFARSAVASVEQLESAAPRLREYLRQPSDATLATAESVVGSLGATNNRTVTIWSADGARLYEAMVRGADDTASGESTLPPVERPPEAGLSPIQQGADGLVFTDLLVTVRDAPRETVLGSVSIRAVVAVTPPDALNRLVGEDALILFGNRDGSLWTDLSGPVPAPRLQTTSDGVAHYRTDGGGLHVAATTQLAGTPWVVWVGLPTAAVESGAQAFLQRMAASVAVVALVALVLVRWFSVRLTVPLTEITTAAEALAAGDYQRRVVSERVDEVGRLGRAFNAMAAEVASAHHELEERVSERTRALSVAMAALSEQSRARETYLATIVDRSADAILSQDLDGRVTSWNRGAERLFGFTAAEMVGTPVDRLIPADGREEDARVASCVLRGDTVEPYETVRQTRDGRLIDLSITASPITDATGRIIGISKVGRDITLRKQADVMLREQRDRAQQYLDTAQVILVAVDLEGRVELLNRYGCQILGRTSDEVIGRSFTEFVPDEWREPGPERFQQGVGGELKVSESPLLTTTGETRWIEWRHTPRLDGAGRVIGTLSSGTDITDRNRAADALKNAEERMRFALQSANVGVWDLDCTTGTLQWSETLEAQYGLAPGTFPGTFDAFTERLHPDDRASVLQAMTGAMAPGQDFFLQHRIVWPDGTVRRLQGAGRMFLGTDGRPVRGSGISWDVTERHRLEEQYQQAQKMEAVGRLAGGVAHDFNNLLTVILGHAELMLEDLPLADRWRPDVVEIRRAGVSAAALTRQLLAFSRKQIIEPTLLDLNDVLRHMRGMVGRLIGEDVEVELSLHPSPVVIMADKGQVEQIVLNLAVNARDAMPDGGTLTIETTIVELDAHYARTHLAVKPGIYCGLTISDTGVGMPPDVVARAFEPFFTTKDVGKGTGLGLATVHGIVTGSGGSVNVYSEPGVGTAFKVYFPMADGAVRLASREAAKPRRPVSTRTVLVVEDAEGLRQLAEMFLRRLGYRVLSASNVDEAWRVCESQPVIDVILTDVVMPGGSGPELIRRLSERRPALRAIYMSGYTEDAIAHHGVLKPGIAFLHKPFTLDTLGRKLEEVLGAEG